MIYKKPEVIEYGEAKELTNGDCSIGFEGWTFDKTGSDYEYVNKWMPNSGWGINPACLKCEVKRLCSTTNPTSNCSTPGATTGCN